MKRRNWLLLAAIAPFVALSQHPAWKDPAVRAADSLRFLKYKSEHPAEFRNTREVYHFSDKSIVVSGHGSSLQLTGVPVADSAEHNWNRGTAPGYMPYTSVKIAGRYLSASLITYGLYGGQPYTVRPDTGLDTSGLREYFLIPRGDRPRSVSMQVSMNGNVVSAWKSLTDYPDSSIVITNKTTAPHPFLIIAQTDAYTAFTGVLELNDQLLIEFKDDTKNWILDRYNITRVAAFPQIASITRGKIQNAINAQMDRAPESAEKKTSR